MDSIGVAYCQNLYTTSNGTSIPAESKNIRFVTENKNNKEDILTSMEEILELEEAVECNRIGDDAIRDSQESAETLLHSENNQENERF